MAEVVRIQLRRGTSVEWSSSNPTLASAEFGVETDTGKFKVGNGSTAWNNLTYFEPIDVDDFVLDADLTSTLSGYVTDSELTTSLSPYLTTSTASSTYQTQAAMSLYAALSGATFTGPVILNADPTVPLGAATKEYVDNVASGILAKPAVKAASTENLLGTYDNGTSGVGSTLNLGQLATLDIDGVTSWTQYDGILLKDQTNAAENGRWVMLQVGNDTDTDWILRRCGLCDEPSEVPGMYIFVTDGTENAGTGWVAVVDDPATFAVGVDDINMYNFTASTSYTAGDGISITGNSIAVTADVVRDSDLTSYVTATSTTTLTNKTIDKGIFSFPFEKYQNLDSTFSLGRFEPQVNLANSPSVGYASISNVNFGLNLIGGAVSSGQTLTYTLIVNQATSGTPGNFTNLYLNGTGVSLLWQGGSAPTGTTGIDVFTFTFINVGSTIALGSMTSYSN